MSQEAKLRELRAAARSSPLLEGASERALDALVALARCHEYPPNNVLFYQGDPGGTAFLVMSGRVKLNLTNEEGREAIVGFVAPGGLLGVVPLLDGGTHPTNATTVARSWLAKFEGDALLAWMERQDGAQKRLFRELAEHVRQAYHRLGEHALLSVRERLLATLLEIAEREGEAESSGGAIVFTRPTHQELADRIGSSREVVSRILKELLESDLLSAEGRVIRVSESALVLKEG